MADFRVKTPKRREITTIVKTYSDHKPELKVDFLSRCGYCDSPDNWKVTYFEVDHFIPYKRNRTIFLTIKALTDYSNLIYSCRSCNNAKRNKWPTNDENIPNQNDEGFIDPCDDDYSNHFDRKNNGEIQFMGALGEWMYYALKFHKPQHQIIWQLEQLEPVIKQIKTVNNLVNIPEHIKDMIIKLFIKYDNYRDELRSI